MTTKFNENKPQCLFIQLDIVEVYLSISENILDNPVIFEEQHTDVFDENLRVIKHCPKSFLYKNYKPRKKNGTDSCFDSTMRSYGAEILELLGIHLLSLLANIVDKNNFIPRS